MSRWEFAVRVPFAALASLLGCTRVRDAVLRRNNCYATTTVSTSIGFQVSPTTGVGGGALEGRAALGAQQIHQRHRVDGYGQF